VTRPPTADPHRPEKRSLTIAGHPTSVRLERIFWQALEEAAAAESRPLGRLIDEIDRARPASLASALRVYAMQRLMRRSPGATVGAGQQAG
jgi:predicted DNA-binding ribbon-helix-helix protein